MIFYIAICISASLFAFLYSKTESKNLAFVFKWTSFLILFLPIALRYNIGTDYSGYIRHIANGAYEDIFELGWVIFIKLILSLNLDLQWFFIIPAFLSLLIIFNFAERRYAYLIIFAYATVMYVNSYTAIRQSFATVIFLLAIKAFLDKQRIKMLFWIILSCLFHKSMLLAGFMLLVCEIDFKFLNSKTNIIILVFIFLLHYIGIGNLIMSNIVSYTLYAHYETSNYNRDAEINSGLGILLKFLIIALMLFFGKKNLINYRLYNVSCIFLFCLAFSFVLFMEIHIFNRIKDIFIIGFMIGLLNMSFSQKQHTKFIIAIIMPLLFILLIGDIKNAQSSNFSGLGIIPYQSIFER